MLTGLIGAGIGPSLSPPLHEVEAGRLGDLVYARFDLDAGRSAELAGPRRPSASPARLPS
ncbi:hypothetical protein [Amycolatopsis sp. MEPSY49]|uniref:hypothetical protein n=1 Tax=Amycolatopsis sp. MEPSY49 TaxID=3151600 RepID=UPI003EF53804